MLLSWSRRGMLYLKEEFDTRYITISPAVVCITIDCAPLCSAPRFNNGERLQGQELHNTRRTADAYTNAHSGLHYQRSNCSVVDNPCSSPHADIILL